MTNHNEPPIHVALLEAVFNAIAINRFNTQIMHRRATDIMDDIKVGMDAAVKFMGDASTRKDEDDRSTDQPSGTGNEVRNSPAQPCEISGVDGIYFAAGVKYED
jgi:hypothetical protein